MVDNDGKNDEEKLDFDSAGEAPGYLSLDQAQVLAMRTALESPGAYGSRFRGTPMAFEAALAEESEDHYVITLSFRPQGEFAGTPGQEQFYVEKEGEVAVRQVLGLPKSKVQPLAKDLGLSTLFMLFVVILIGLGALIFYLVDRNNWW